MKKKKLFALATGTILVTTLGLLGFRNVTKANDDISVTDSKLRQLTINTAIEKAKEDPEIIDQLFTDIVTGSKYTDEEMQNRVVQYEVNPFEDGGGGWSSTPKENLEISPDFAPDAPTMAELEDILETIE